MAVILRHSYSVRSYFGGFQRGTTLTHTHTFNYSVFTSSPGMLLDVEHFCWFFDRSNRDPQPNSKIRSFTWQNIKHSWRLECSPHALQGPGACLWQGLSAEVVWGFDSTDPVNTRMNSLRLTLYISQSISLPHTDLAIPGWFGRATFYLCTP